jgi:hypothetical protein
LINIKSNNKIRASFARDNIHSDIIIKWVAALITTGLIK